MEGDVVIITCRDGYELVGRHWRPVEQSANRPAVGAVIVNPATGVLARYYHAFARFLAGQGFAVLAYDYRGIGASRPAAMRQARMRWRDWGALDFDAAVAWMRRRHPDGPLSAVGHSIGGFLPGFAPNAVHLDRILTVGAQYAYWRDYRADLRARLFLKWHVAMPAVTALCGYFPGRRLGWLEDLPAGVAYEWSFRRERLEDSYPRHESAAVLAGFAAVRAPILAIGLTDDEFGTADAIARGLHYYTGSERQQLLLAPADLGSEAIGHFDLFRDRHRERVWQATLSWLRDGINPWPSAVVRQWPASARPDDRVLRPKQHHTTLA